LAPEGQNIDGFLSQEGDSQISVINALVGSLSAGKSQTKKQEVITASQIRREEEELEEIDAIMEDMIEDDDEDLAKNQDKSFSPSQPVLMSQKAGLLQDAL